MEGAPDNPDRELVDAVLANRPGAFERLVREYQGLCWHIIQRMVRNPEDARELCQDTFLRVHQCLHQYRGESALKSWIGRVAWTIALRHLQHKRIPLVEPHSDDEGDALLENIGDGFDLEAACMDEETRRHLHEAIEALPPLQRTVLTLYYLDETSIPEIARITGLAGGTIKEPLVPFAPAPARGAGKPDRSCGMNHDTPPFDNPAHEREWQVQERALQAERLGLDPSNGDERVRRYRLLARTLREPMPPALPEDFAQRMAARVAAKPAPGKADDSRLEFALTGALVAALAVAAGVVVADYGSAWLPAFRQLLPAAGSPATNWGLALGACLGGSWLLGLWQKPGHGHAAPG